MYPSKPLASLPRLQLIFRRKDPLFFSIENVFGSLKPFLEKEFIIEESILPYFSNSLRKVFMNVASKRGSKAEIYHVTGDVHYMVFSFPVKSTLLTIHDTVFLEKSSGLKRWVLKKVFLDAPVRRARFISTISQKSKEEIIRHTGCSGEKIRVIPDPVGDAIYFSEKKLDISSPVLLFIGSTPNKNLDRVISALKGIPCLLEIVGVISQEQKSALEANEIKFQLFQNLSDQEMADRFAGCDMLLFPSLYEGFGLPVIEAQKAGRPVVTSHLSPMKEVSGGTTCLVDPFHIDSIRDGVLKVLNDYDYRLDLIRKGLENVQKYRPESIAMEYLDLYQRILNEVR